MARSRLIPLTVLLLTASLAFAPLAAAEGPDCPDCPSDEEPEETCTIYLDFRIDSVYRTVDSCLEAYT